MKLRISSRERSLLGRISLHADRSVPELARLSKQSVHNVRYTLQRLEEAEILKRTWIIDVFKLGLLRTQILFSNTGHKRKAVIDYFKKHKNTGHFNEIGGAYDFDFLCITDTHSEVLKIMHEASAKFDSIFNHKILSVQNQVAYFPRKYLANISNNKEQILLGLVGAKVKIDNLSLGIINCLIHKPEITHQSIADELSVSIPTVLQRIKNLKQSGIIAGCVFSPRFSELGVQNYKVLFNLNNSTPVLHDSILNFAKEHPHITTLRVLLGEWDYEYNIEVENNFQFLNFKDSFYQKFEGLLYDLEIIPRFKVHHYATFPGNFSLT